MNEKVEYKGIEYQVTKVQTSAGTAYKKPKEGNEFVVITLSLKNKNDEKVTYSYQNWKMTNSKLELSGRIFVPISDTVALYSGSLVVGGQKTGSLVFEQPINDPELIIHFYELDDETNYTDQVEVENKIFSFRIIISK